MNNISENIVIDFMATWKCNLRCKKCFVPKSGKEVSSSEIYSAFEKLHKAGVRRLVITGGDPLLRVGIEEIIQHANKLGFTIYLSTNGILLKHKWNYLSQSISWVSLSLDCSTVENNERFIGKGGKKQFESVLDFLEYYQNTEKTAKIKLATLITNKNKDELLALGKLIFEKQKGYKPDVWRLYQFSDQFSEEQKDIQSYDKIIKSLNISNEEADSIICELRSSFPNIQISYRPSISRDKSFFFLSPDLILTYPDGKLYIPIGDVKSMTSGEINEVLKSQQIVWDKVVTNREIYK